MTRQQRRHRRLQRARRARTELGILDRRLLTAAAEHRSPTLDRVLTTASTAANRSMLWLGAAAVLTVSGRRDHRSAAAAGLLGIGIASTLVNGPLKFLWRRDRPPTDVAPLLPLPRTFSFPSGHSASAFAFAVGVARACPSAGAAALPAAAAVAYSRVHTGVHYPSDVVVGAGVGVASGLVGARLVRHARANGVHRLAGPGEQMPIPRDVVLVSSGASGDADALGHAQAALREAGFTVRDQLPVAKVAALTDMVRGSQPPLVIAAGGDGTVGAAAGAIVGSEALLAVVPLGTSNDVARSIGVPADPVLAASGLAQARVWSVDAGQVRTAEANEQIFLHAATIGLNVEFAQLATRKSMRDRFGGLTYPIAAAIAVRRYQPFTCEVEHDGERTEMDIVHLSVSNAPVFGGLLGMRVRDASMTDGLLDVTIVERLSQARLALAVADTLIGRHEPVHRVHTFKARTLRVTTSGDEQVAIDGEVEGRAPFDFTTLPGAVRVAVPPREPDLP